MRRYLVTTTVLATVTEEWTLDAPSEEAARAWIEGDREVEDLVEMLDVENVNVYDEQDRTIQSVTVLRNLTREEEQS